MSHTTLFDAEFRTARPSRPLYCHQDFLDKLAERRNEPVGKRTSLLLQRMAVDIGRLHYKGTNGINKGWRRSRLGGSSGSHFYAWWAPAGASVLGAEDAAEDAVFLRDIRHHDDHTPLNAGSLGEDYMPLNVAELRSGEFTPEPWTGGQLKFAKSHALARILKGHPGSGKTTALLHAADASQAERVLYVTFSTDLAALARDYFDRYCSGGRTFTVLTFAALLEQLAGPRKDAVEMVSREEGKARFRRDLGNYQRQLGAWANDLEALYDEVHAHVVGAAMPEACGRFAKAERVKLPDSAYLAQRMRSLGKTAADQVLEAVKRLERPNEAPLADRYFPELAMAWRVAHALQAGKHAAIFSGYGCIAVDEVQDLTPLEAYVVVKLARRLNEGSIPVPLMLAGDEAQTVRATDFEWAWLNDMLHSSLSQPQEFKMQVNLRSPKRIAALVNRAWDFYDFLQKQDRPSGTGYAEIDDESPDQIVYAAVTQDDLPGLLGELSQREGMALISFDKTKVPKTMLPFVLSPAEAKGLDFHSVCVLQGGPLLRRIHAVDGRGVEQILTKRLAIDQLRVVLSRPTERLVWIDASPDFETVTGVGQLLGSPAAALPPISGEALRASLAEEELDVEERIQRCQKDARQLLAVKPDLAWSRAHQAVALLGVPGELGAVKDNALWSSARLTLAEVCFLLAFRKQGLSQELGHPDLFDQAAVAAGIAGKRKLGRAMRAVGETQIVVSTVEWLNKVAEAVTSITEAKDELPGWFLVELTPRAAYWIEEMERNLAAGDNATIAYRMLPPFFLALAMPDAEARTAKLGQRAVQVLMKAKKWGPALGVLDQMPGASPLLQAECKEELGDFAAAAAIYLKQGDKAKALKCYRSAPDFAQALALVKELEDHPARVSLEWLGDLSAVLERRPANFNRVMIAPEKALLENLLERGLGVERKKKAPVAAKKPAARKKQGAPAVKKQSPTPKTPRGNPYF